MLLRNVEQLDDIEDTLGRRIDVFLLQDVILTQNGSLVMDNDLSPAPAIFDDSTIDQDLLVRLQRQLQRHQTPCRTNATVPVRNWLQVRYRFESRSLQADRKPGL